MTKRARPQTDPLLAALIDKLPPTGAEFPVDRQLAWLHNAAMAFGLVYGGDAAARLAKPTDTLVPVPPFLRHQPPAAPAKPATVYPFIIDKDGYARNGKTNARVSPDQITDMIADLRGMDGDMKTIVWSDDSTGLNGRDLTIVAA